MLNFTPTELEALVHHRAPEIAREIRDTACKACNEADLVAAVERVIVTLNLERERALVNGRADAVYNRFVIEYEPPTSRCFSRLCRPRRCISSICPTFRRAAGIATCTCSTASSIRSST